MVSFFWNFFEFHELCSRIFRVALLFICQGTSKADRCAIILESLLSQNVLCNEMLCDSAQRAVFFCELSLLLCCFVLFVSPATMYTISSSPMIVNTNFKNFSDIFRQASKALILQGFSAFLFWIKQLSEKVFPTAALFFICYIATLLHIYISLWSNLILISQYLLRS